MITQVIVLSIHIIDHMPSRYSSVEIKFQVNPTRNPNIWSVMRSKYWSTKHLNQRKTIVVSPVVITKCSCGTSCHGGNERQRSWWGRFSIVGHDNLRSLPPLTSHRRSFKKFNRRIESTDSRFGPRYTIFLWSCILYGWLIGYVYIEHTKLRYIYK